MWTKSTTVLQWLHSIDKQPVFVANRVTEILELNKVDESIHATADAGTRGLSAKSPYKELLAEGSRLSDDM